MRAYSFDGCRGAGRITALLVLVLALSVCSCSGTFNSLKGSIFGEEGAPARTEGTGEAAPSVYYVASDGLVLYREPGKTVVARLPLHQKVYRYRLERGYAYVKVAGTGQEGWLDNGRLIWRLPQAAAPATSPAPEGPAEAALPPAADTAASPSAPDSESPDAAAGAPSVDDPDATPPVSPSVFEPY